MFGFIKKETGALPQLKFHNTLSGTLEIFTPLTEGRVKMYNCGPTVYDRQHIGNMFSVVFGNTLRRTLEAWGYDVQQVINITDLGHLSGDNEGDANVGEDRMSKGLKKEGMALTLENMHILAEKYAELYLKDIALIGVDTSSIQFPRASAYIPEQIALIQTLEEKGYAYKIKDGVYFDTSRFSTYGKLGGINLSGQKEGARVSENNEKRTPFDFVLWKSDKKIGWQSPWGLGFPGWHIECTAMIFKLLGKQIDIHTGGIEHIPIHHNNEIAQAEAVSGKQFSRYWMHNSHITIEGKKISKSLRNTVYLHNITDRGLSAKAFRYWALTGHYRTPSNFTWDALEGAGTALARLNRFFFEELSKAEGGEADSQFVHDFMTAMANDLDTPKALARVWELVKDDAISPAAKRASLLHADTMLCLGLSDEREQTRLTVIPQTQLPEDVQKLLAERDAAREAKDFAKADNLRAQLEALGYDVKDTAHKSELSRR